MSKNSPLKLYDSFREWLAYFTRVRKYKPRKRKEEDDMS